jgi:hypothetical protein
MIPMRQAGNDNPVEILENRVEGFGSLRWRLRKLLPDIAGLHSRKDGVSFGMR